MEVNDCWNGSNEVLLQDEEEDRYQKYLNWLAAEGEKK